MSIEGIVSNLPGLLTRFCWYHDSPIICQGSNLRSNPRVKNTFYLHCWLLVVKIEFTWETFHPTLPSLPLPQCSIPHPSHITIVFTFYLPFYIYLLLYSLHPFSTCFLPLYTPSLPAHSLTLCSLLDLFLASPFLYKVYTLFMPALYTPSLPVPSLLIIYIPSLPALPLYTPSLPVPSLLIIYIPSLPGPSLSIVYSPSLPAPSLSTPLLYLLPL